MEKIKQEQTDYERLTKLENQYNMLLQEKQEISAKYQSLKILHKEMKKRNKSYIKKNLMLEKKLKKYQ
jgi:hypothetical protein